MRCSAFEAWAGPEDDGGRKDKRDHVVELWRLALYPLALTIHRIDDLEHTRASNSSIYTGSGLISTGR